MGLNDEFRGHAEFMCLASFRGLLSRTPYEVWDVLKYLAWETWEFEQAREALIHSPSDPPACQSEPCHHDQFRDPYFLQAYVPPVLCQSYCHNMHSCPLFARTDALEHCVKDMMEEFFAIQYRKCYNDLPVTHPSLGYPMPNVSPVDDFESFLPQRPNLHVDTPFSALKEENDIPITLDVSPLEPNTPRDRTSLTMS